MKYTPQQIIDKVYDVFIVKAAPKCAADYGGCYYSPQNLLQVGCAVGCLISPEDQEIWDSGQVQSIRDIYQCRLEDYNRYFLIEDLNLLIDLQDWHDNFRGVDIPTRKAELMDICQEYDLDYPSGDN